MKSQWANVLEVLAALVSVAPEVGQFLAALVNGDQSVTDALKSVLDEKSEAQRWLESLDDE